MPHFTVTGLQVGVAVVSHCQPVSQGGLQVAVQVAVPVDVSQTFGESQQVEPQQVEFAPQAGLQTLAAHCPAWLQPSPLGQVPQVQLQPSSPHRFPAH